MGQLAPDLEEGGELDRGGLADGAPEQRALDACVEAVAAVDDVAGEFPISRLRRYVEDGATAPGAPPVTAG